jgi:hypothetical protein
MQAYIQHQKTKLYYTSEGAWTPHRQLALSFPRAMEAFTAAMDANLHDVDVVVFSDDRLGEVRVPVKAPDRPTA